MILCTLELSGEFPTLNEYIQGERSNKYIGAKIKKEATQRVAWEVKQHRPLTEKVHCIFQWYTKDKRKDHDNIAFAKKFILDGCVEGGLLQGDSPKHIGNFCDVFLVDKLTPRVVVQFYTDEEEVG